MKKPRTSPRTPARAARTAAKAPTFTPVPTRRRHDGWTPEKQIDFLEALAACACVKEACASVGMSKQSAYRLYARVDAQPFRMAWEAALNLGVRRLSEACFSRALHGVAVPHFYKGEQVGEHRRYDNRLAMFLLRYRDPVRYAASLDQMVYAGEPESAALAFARARDRAEAAAFGMRDAPGTDAPAAADPPWTKRPIHQELEEGRERALIEGDAPIHGTFMRRQRLNEARDRHRLNVGYREDYDPDAEAAEIIRQMEERLSAAAAERRSEG